MDVKKEDVSVSTLSVSEHPQYMDHETIFKIHAEKQGVTALVGIHNSALGPALGGIRYQYYANEQDALGDVLRLSEAMTWKNAAGGLEHGGGKSVIMAPEGSRAPDNITLDVFAHGLNIINENGALYFGAEDMNMGEAALDYIYERASWIKGATSSDPSLVSGTPSPLTAIGVFECMKLAAKNKLGTDSLKNVRVSLQGLGSVGAGLARLLHNEGATLIAADTSDIPFETLSGENIKIQRVGLDEIYDAPADIFAPNAIGGTLTDDTINRLHKAGVKIVCGAANNQQQDQAGGSQSRLMHEQGILFCPDYIVNAGGVIWVAMVGQNAKTATNDIRTGVPRRFAEVLALYDENGDKDMWTLAAEYSKKRVRAAEENRQQKRESA